MEAGAKHTHETQPLFVNELFQIYLRRGTNLPTAWVNLEIPYNTETLSFLTFIRVLSLISCWKTGAESYMGLKLNLQRVLKQVTSTDSNASRIWLEKDFKKDWCRTPANSTGSLWWKKSPCSSAFSFVG
jgi:hypothetical protein